MISKEAEMQNVKEKWERRKCERRIIKTHHISFEINTESELLHANKTNSDKRDLYTVLPILNSRVPLSTNSLVHFLTSRRRKHETSYILWHVKSETSHSRIDNETFNLRSRKKSFNVETYINPCLGFLKIFSIPRIFSDFHISKKKYFLMKETEQKITKFGPISFRIKE